MYDYMEQNDQVVAEAIKFSFTKGALAGVAALIALWQVTSFLISQIA